MCGNVGQLHHQPGGLRIGEDILFTERWFVVYDTFGNLYNVFAKLRKALAELGITAARLDN